MNEFAVVQEVYQTIPQEILAPILGEALGLLPIDANHRAKEARGVVAEKLDTARAQWVASSLAAQGVETKVIPQEWVIRIGKPILVRTLHVADDALHLALGYTGPPQPIPWDQVWLLSAGEIVEVQEGRRTGGKSWKRRMSWLQATGIGGALYDTLLKEYEGLDRLKPLAGKQTAIEIADLFASSPGGDYLHVRLRSRDLYYDQILGAQASRNFAHDFRLVLARIGLRAARAVATPGYRAMSLAPGDPSFDPAEARFGIENEFSEFNRWQLQMLALSWWEPGAAGGEPISRPEHGASA
ncbi:MAG: hypothetical protein HY720_18160 [Planctomycetes bacterium]|nr:hypothetical protein [Planctomycetota bacterium]